MKTIVLERRTDVTRAGPKIQEPEAGTGCSIINVPPSSIGIIMVKMTKKAIQNGLIFVEDSKGGKPPYPFTNEKVQYTASCISVACLHEIDGEAELILGPAAEVAPSFDLAFDGPIETPSKELMLSSVGGEPLVKAAVPNGTTRVRVWRNHPDWADKVVVGWD